MELDQEAWERWKSYREVIKKPLKSVSEEAAKLKFMRYGDDQAAVVEQSIANGWQGLFALAKEKADPHAPKVRTKEQQQAADAHFEYLNKQSEKNWDGVNVTPLGRLQLCEAALARFDVESDQSSLVLSEKRSALRDVVARLLRECDPRLSNADYHVRRMVLRLFADAGLRRLELRAREAA